MKNMFSNLFNTYSWLKPALIAVAILGVVGHHFNTVNGLENELTKVNKANKELVVANAAKDKDIERLSQINRNNVETLEQLQSANDELTIKKSELELALQIVDIEIERRDEQLRSYEGKLSEKMLSSKPYMLERRMSVASLKVLDELKNVSTGN